MDHNRVGLRNLVQVMNIQLAVVLHLRIIKEIAVDPKARLCFAVELPHVKKLIQLGQRGLANDEEAMGNARKHHTQIITGEQIHRKGVDWVLSQIPEGGNIYITLDVDVMDPTLAPGTGTLEPDGLNFSELDGLLKGVTSKGHLVGIDIVEVNPMRDSSTRTEQTAIRLLVDTLGAAFK